MDRDKILIIDDEQGFLDLVSERLELEGYDVATAFDGENGIQKAKTWHPDLIICDVKMPKKDGFEVLKNLRHEKNMRVPFVMMTLVDDFEKIKKAYDEEADFYVTKPVELARLSKNIRILLNLSQTRKE